jgi:hypothetical protein
MSDTLEFTLQGIQTLKDRAENARANLQMSKHQLLKVAGLIQDAKDQLSAAHFRAAEKIVCEAEKRPACNHQNLWGFLEVATTGGFIADLRKAVKAKLPDLGADFLKLGGFDADNVDEFSIDVEGQHLAIRIREHKVWFKIDQAYERTSSYHYKFEGLPDFEFTYRGNYNHNIRRRTFKRLKTGKFNFGSMADVALAEYQALVYDARLLQRQEEKRKRKDENWPIADKLNATVGADVFSPTGFSTSEVMQVKIHWQMRADQAKRLAAVLAEIRKENSP